MEDRAGDRVGEMSALAQGLADPTRLAVLRFLAAEGPQTVPEIAMEVGVSGSRLANHLARLRTVGLVSVTHRSRQAIYAVDDEVRTVLRTLDALAGDPKDAPAAGVEASTAEAVTPARRERGDMLALAKARTCYGHLGGILGVRFFDYLLKTGAIRLTGEPADAVEVSLADPQGFLSLGVDPAAIEPGRRRLAYCCVDWTENRQHLGGVLADALLTAMLDHGQLVRVPGSRALQITPRGQRELPVALD